MLPVATVISRLSTRRCFKSNVALKSHEACVSSSAFPALYAGEAEASEQNYLKLLLKALLPAVPLFSDDSPERVAVREFLSLLVRNGKMVREQVIHHYVFHFWEHIWRDTDELIPLHEKYFEGQTEGQSSPFATKLVPNLRAAEAYPDVVARGGRAGRDLLIIEVKLGSLDDRAVGQILRYFHLARAACDATFHDCDIRTVAPILVVREVQPEFWLALPLYFRELLQLYVYRVDGHGHVRLHDAKHLLRSQARGRTVHSLV